MIPVDAAGVRVGDGGRTTRAVRWLGGACVLLLGSWCLGADFFVSPAGDDAQPGTSRGRAWRTVERVNQADLEPGDSVWFEGGASFAGHLQITAEDAGRPDRPVVVGSYGRGRATLMAGMGTGITVENAGGVVLRDLVVAGAGPTRNAGYGIRCDQSSTNTARLVGLTLERVETRGFGLFGVLISGAKAGYERVVVRDCVFRGNLRGGMEVAGRLPWDAAEYAHADVRVERCDAYDNTGDPDYLKNHSGSGIVLYQVDGGIMEHCRAWNNGVQCRSPGGGGVGLWVCASRRVVIQHCESFGNRTSAADGGGFDIDGGCTECVLQYNFSHDNDGPGLMVYSYAYASHRDHGNVVRFNLSVNDSRRGRRYAGLWVRTDGPDMTGLRIHNNTVVSGPWTDHAAYVHGKGVEAVLRNNVFVSRSPAVALRVEEPGASLRFENNLYWTQGGPVAVVWGPERFEQIDAWRVATGQETWSGRPVGWFADPALLGSQARPRRSLRWPGAAAYAPPSGSFLIEGGLDLREWDPRSEGKVDLAGRRLAGRYPVGAFAGPVHR